MKNISAQKYAYFLSYMQKSRTIFKRHTASDFHYLQPLLLKNKIKATQSPGSHLQLAISHATYEEKKKKKKNYMGLIQTL